MFLLFSPLLTTVMSSSRGLVADKSPSQGHLFFRYASAHHRSCLFAAGVKSTILPPYEESVEGDDAQENNIDSKY